MLGLLWFGREGSVFDYTCAFRVDELDELKVGEAGRTSCKYFHYIDGENE